MRIYSRIETRYKYRRKGFAKLVAAKLIQECMKKELESHWDAANSVSCKLAENLGYTYKVSYEVYRIHP